MTEIILPRRKFLIGMAGLLAAPAIVRIENLMPVRSSFRHFTLADYVDKILRPMMKEYELRLEKQIEIDILYGTTNTNGLQFSGLSERIRLPNDYQITDLHKNG